jgi:hypothetical protein
MLQIADRHRDYGYNIFDENTYRLVSVSKFRRRVQPDGEGCLLQTLDAYNLEVETKREMDVTLSQL